MTAPAESAQQAGGTRGAERAPRAAPTRECTCIAECGKHEGDRLGDNWYCRIDRERAERAPRAATPEPDAGDVQKVARYKVYDHGERGYQIAESDDGEYVWYQDHADALESLAAALAAKEVECAGLRRDAERIKDALAAIEMESRDGAQWGFAEINECARAAIDAAKDSVESSNSTPTGKPLGES